MTHLVLDKKGSYLASRTGTPPDIRATLQRGAQNVVWDKFHPRGHYLRNSVALVFAFPSIRVRRTSSRLLDDPGKKVWGSHQEHLHARPSISEAAPQLHPLVCPFVVGEV